MAIKKLFIMALCILLGAAVTVSGTLAYFTDRENEAEVFTDGNVSIELSGDFGDGVELLPNKKIEKEVYITNTGDSSAWVWMTVSIPSALDDDQLSSANILHWNVPGCVWEGFHTTQKYIDSGIAAGYITEAQPSNKTWNVNDKVEVQKGVEIEGVSYNVYTLLYNGVLGSGERTNVGLNQIYIDAAVDIAPDGNWYKVVDGVATRINWNCKNDGNPTVYVDAYAIQANDFADVKAAYDAYTTEWGNGGTE